MNITAGGSTVLFVIVVGCVLMAFTTPTNEAFDQHIKDLTEASIKEASAALAKGIEESPLGAIAGVFGLHNLGGAASLLVEMVGSVLPNMYTRKDYGIFCIYVIGGDAKLQSW